MRFKAVAVGGRLCGTPGDDVYACMTTALKHLLRPAIVLLASLTMAGACDSGPTTPLSPGLEPAPAPISPDVIRVAAGQSVTFTVGRTSPISVITNATEFAVHFQPVRITSSSAVATLVELRLVGDVIPETQIWQPGTIWYCCNNPRVVIVRVPGGRGEVDVEVQNPPTYGGTQTVTLVATRVG